MIKSLWVMLVAWAIDSLPTTADSDFYDTRAGIDYGQSLKNLELAVIEQSFRLASAQEGW